MVTQSWTVLGASKTLIFIMNLQEGDILLIGHLYQSTVSASY